MTGNESRASLKEDAANYSDIIGKIERVFSAIGGAALVYKGIKDLQDDTMQGVGFMVAGGALLYRGISGKPFHDLIEEVRGEE